MSTPTGPANDSRRHQHQTIALGPETAGRKPAPSRKHPRPERLLCHPPLKMLPSFRDVTLLWRCYPKSSSCTKRYHRQRPPLEDCCSVRYPCYHVFSHFDFYMPVSPSSVFCSYLSSSQIGSLSPLNYLAPRFACQCRLVTRLYQCLL